MKRLLSIAIIAISSLSMLAQGYKNPILPGFRPDPSVCRVGDDYYLVNSSFQFFPGVPISHSRDLIHWEQIGNVLDRPSQLNLKNVGPWGGIYAPTIRFHEGKYYMIVTNVSDKGNFICTATHPSGPWSDPIWLKQGGIDPSLYFEDNTCYMLSTENGQLLMCEINPATGDQLTPSKSLWEGTGARYTEGPHIYKVNGYYYLMAAEGGTEYGHKESIARSRTIYGPYESNPTNPILTHINKNAQSNIIQGTGHADLVQASDGSWWMVCLAFRMQGGTYHNTGRETYLTPVTWSTDGWPVVNSNGTISVDMQCSTLPQVTMPVLPERDDFDSPKLSFVWRHISNPHFENYSYNTERPGYMRLKTSTVNLDSNDSPTFIGRIQENPKFSATTSMDITHLKSGAEAGLSVYMAGNYRYDVGVAVNRGKPYLTVTYCIAQIYHVAATIPLTAKTIYLRVTGDENDYHFAYSVDNKKFNTLTSMASRIVSTEVAGGFTGVTIGLFATSKNVDGSYADFDWFDYKNN